MYPWKKVLAKVYLIHPIAKHPDSTNGVKCSINHFWVFTTTCNILYMSEFYLCDLSYFSNPNDYMFGYFVLKISLRELH